ncbi:hypothetical protein CLOSTMETH_01237 [[Clostridium] methylpentosum DSM 5476]|uniref:Uncharacterized protein n=1 Tax=[Clostridium] methylpentosum DSM 5476 TaxID=537013 RepID=C0EBL9_9FIRM|nr:hypothetical protein CLOSTMETH_01237 [[Clostridium] methylpentosum DSM 5476]
MLQSRRFGTRRWLFSSGTAALASVLKKRNAWRESSLLNEQTHFPGCCARRAAAGIEQNVKRNGIPLALLQLFCIF